MTNATKSAALKKANQFTALIGYDDYLADNISKLNEEYEKVL